MPTKRLTMRRIHRLMTMHFGAGVGTRVIARELCISHSTVREYLARIAAAGITWPLPVAVTDEALERQLFANGGARAGARHYAEPDWAVVARELKRPGVNLMILWEEYRAVHADGYAYSRYCASCSGSSSAGCRRACGRRMLPVTRRSSTSRARRSRSSTR
jgi:transposase